MSEHYVCFIPADPKFVPSKGSQDAAVALIQRAWLHISEITPETNEHIVFRDCGENFESIHCPSCNTELKVDQWHELMEQDYSDEGGFQLDQLPMPCCEEKLTLNDLSYKWPMGFSRFVLRAGDPGCEDSEKLLNELESAIGCQLRIIHQMY